MSVTFEAYKPVGDIVEPVTPEGWIQEYELDSIYGRIPVNDNPLSLNVANGNYCRLMDLLGLDHSDYCGTWNDGSLQVVREKLVFTLQSLQSMPELDGGTISESGMGENGCTWIDCGVREGYFQERIQTLLDIVNAAINSGGTVVFG